MSLSYSPSSQIVSQVRTNDAYARGGASQRQSPLYVERLQPACRFRWRGLQPWLAWPS